VEYGGIGTMSKSSNGVDPQELIDRFGADTARLCVMYAGRPTTARCGPTRASGRASHPRRLWTFARRVQTRSRRPRRVRSRLAPAVKAAPARAPDVRQATLTTTASSTTPSFRRHEVLNALDAMPPTLQARTLSCARVVDPAPRPLSVVPHIGCALDELAWRNSALPTPRGRRPTRPHSRRTRSSSSCRSTASCAERSSCPRAPIARRSRAQPGQRPKWRSTPPAQR
jgi:hypothetical protein